MHRTHDIARSICADGDKSEVEGAAMLADFGEGGAVRKGGELRVVPVVAAVGFFGDGAVAGVAGEVDGTIMCGGVGCGVADGPAGPECAGFVAEGAGGDVLAGEAGDSGGHGGGRRFGGSGGGY